MILECKKIKPVTVSIFSCIYLPWSDETGCHDLSFLNTEFYATCVHISLCHVFLVFVSWIPWSFFFFLAFYYFDIFEKCRSDIYSISLIFGLRIFLVVTFRLCILVQEYHSSDTQVMLCLSQYILSDVVDPGHLIKLISTTGYQFLHWKINIILLWLISILWEGKIS